MSVDPPEVSERFRQRLGAGFTFLSDEEGVLLDELNIRHRKGMRDSDIAFPTGVLVDKHAVVRWVYEAEFGHMRMTPKDLFEAMERLTLEEQNCELRRGRAVGKVVRQVFLMREPEDLGSAIEAMQKELRRFELSFSICGIAIVDESSGKVRTIGAFPDADHERLMMEISAGEVPELQQLVPVWRTNEVPALEIRERKLLAAP